MITTIHELNKQLRVDLASKGSNLHRFSLRNRIHPDVTSKLLRHGQQCLEAVMRELGILEITIRREDADEIEEGMNDRDNQ